LELEKQDRELAQLRTSTVEMAKELQEARREGEDWREEAERRQQRVEETEGALAAYQEVKLQYRDPFSWMFCLLLSSQRLKGATVTHIRHPGHVRKESSLPSLLFVASQRPQHVLRKETRQVKPPSLRNAEFR
jgi:hypothetical protein